MIIVQSEVRRSSLVALSTATVTDESVTEGEAEEEEEGLMMIASGQILLNKFSDQSQKSFFQENRIFPPYIEN